MFERTSPASVGISEVNIRRFMARLVDLRIDLHSVLLMRGNRVFFEKYFAPFTAEMPHRLYSVTKSFVSVAIGFLLQEGRLKLTDRICSFFPDKLPASLDPLLAMQTVEDMLTMRTCFESSSWFREGLTDRTAFYFSQKPVKAPGTIYHYDSNGSYVLGALVERLSGMSLLDYLRSRVLDEIGGFEDACILQTPDGTAWGDSALVARPEGLLAFARFCMNYGTWNGKRLLNEDYLRKATSAVTDNNVIDNHDYNLWGYGYQFRTTEHGGFSMNGLGSQFAICLPEKDLIMVCTGDTQGSSDCDSPRIFETFFRYIADRADGAEPAERELALDAPLAIRTARGNKTSPFAAKLDGVPFTCRENPMGITDLTLHFRGGEGVLEYRNAQGRKELPFGFGKPCFVKFPQRGYSDDRGNVHDADDPFLYDCAVSGGWLMERMLQLRVQILDRYLGILIITLAFREDGLATLRMSKSAEDFLDEYQGWAIAECHRAIE